MIRFENEFGFGYKNEKYICFFGNVLATDLSLEKQFPEFKFLRIKQTHSDIIRPADDSLFEADAHYTDQKNLALRIQTADCMPIMIFCEQTQRIAAVHAGWRGVVNNITRKTITHLIKTGSTQKKFLIFVGPSIQQNSFEVDEDVFNQLITLNEKNYIQQNSKYYVDLNALLLNQINLVCDSCAQVTFSKIDTKTDLNYYSYRRGKSSIERNVSFICLLT